MRSREAAGCDWASQPRLLDTAFVAGTMGKKAASQHANPVPQHFERQGRRLRIGFGNANATAYSSVAAGCLSGYRHVMGGGRSLRRQMEGEPVQEQTHRRNEG